MRVTLSLFADFALAHEGDHKLYVVGGGINILQFPAFPATQSQLALALGIEIPPDQLGASHTLIIEVTTPEAVQSAEPIVKPVPVTFTLPTTEEASLPGYLHYVSNMTNVTFPAPGDYVFAVSIDGTRVHDAHLLLHLSGGPVPADVLLMDGYHAFAEGDADRAERIFRDVVERYPNAPGGHNNLGFVLLSKGDAATALASFTKARELGYELTEVSYANYGTAVYLVGNYDLAVRLFEYCLQQVFRGVATLFVINESKVFPIELHSASEYVALMTLNAAWSALKSGDPLRMTRHFEAARMLDLGKREDQGGRSFAESLAALETRRSTAEA